MKDFKYLANPKPKRPSFDSRVWGGWVLIIVECLMIAAITVYFIHQL